MIFIKFYRWNDSVYPVYPLDRKRWIWKRSCFRPHFILPYNRAHRQARAVACFPSLLSSVASRHNLTASSPKPSVYNWSILNRITYTIWFIYVGVARARAHTLHRGMRPPPSVQPVYWFRIFDIACRHTNVHTARRGRCIFIRWIDPYDSVRVYFVHSHAGEWKGFPVVKPPPPPWFPTTIFPQPSEFVVTCCNKCIDHHASIRSCRN